MAVTKQFSVSLANKPGQLAKLCRTLAKGKVNIKAISVVESADCGLVRFIPGCGGAAKKALKGAKIDAVVSEVVAVRLPNKPGVLAKTAAKMAKAGVNISYVYGSTNPDSKKALCVFGVDNVKKAAKVLR